MKLTVGLKKQGNSYKILSDPNTALSPTLYVRSYVYSQLAKAELIYLAHKHKQLNEWVNNCKVPCPLGKCRLKVSCQLNDLHIPNNWTGLFWNPAHINTGNPLQGNNIEYTIKYHKSSIKPSPSPPLPLMRVPFQGKKVNKPCPLY